MSTLSPSGLKTVNALASPGQALDDNFTLLNATVGLQIAAATLTGLTGGGSTKLDGIVTVGLSAGAVVQVWNGNMVVPYRLRAGTDAEASPFIIRPDDYAASTNEKVWEMVGNRAASVVGSGSLWSLVASTFTLPNFGTTNPTFVVPSTGTYLVSYAISVRYLAGVGRLNARVRDTTASSTKINTKTVDVGSGEDECLTDLQVVSLTAGNTIELQCCDTVGATGALELSPNTSLTYVRLY